MWQSAGFASISEASIRRLKKHIKKTQKLQGGLPRATSCARNDDSFLDSAESQNLVKKELCEAPENSPASWCKKSESKGAVVPPADFLLEADKRGSPPKSEKAAAFWEHNKKELGGAGRGGVQPFLRKEISENCGEGGAESSVDSANLLKSGLPRSLTLACNDDFY